MSYKRRFLEESEELRNALRDIVSLSSLSVYRLRNGEDFEIRDKYGSKIINPVDFRLEQLLQHLTRYQLDLSQKARDIANDLQKEVLASILYSRDDSIEKAYALSFNKEEEKENLISAYTQLGAIDQNIKRKITFHIDSIEKTLVNIKSEENIDFRSLEAFRKTQKIIRMSLLAKDKTSLVFS
ncbi:TPA: ATP-binding protein, partial [Yersinia enterocolitica]|nr:ATP-binding protein [Yersinia enterocolitica]